MKGCSIVLTAPRIVVMADSSRILTLRVLPRPMTRGFTVHHLVRSGGVLITRDADGTWAVYGHEAERAVAVGSTDQGRICAEAHLMLLRVDEELATAGASPGDLVRIGRLEFDCVARRDGHFHGVSRKGPEFDT